MVFGFWTSHWSNGETERGGTGGKLLLTSNNQVIKKHRRAIVRIGDSRKTFPALGHYSRDSDILREHHSLSFINCPSNFRRCLILQK